MTMEWAFTETPDAGSVKVNFGTFPSPGASEEFDEHER
jgi:hypothetical protein